MLFELWYFFLFKPKEFGSYYTALQLENIKVCTKEYLCLHFAPSMFNNDLSCDNIISSKVQFTKWLVREWLL